MSLKEAMNGRDVIHLGFDRESIEKFKVSEFLTMLEEIRSEKQFFKRKVCFMVIGYDNDRRELFEISEVRKFFKFLLKSFPLWFYFVDIKLGSLDLLAACTCELKPHEKISGINYVKYDLDSLGSFLKVNQTELRKLAPELGLSEFELEEIKKEVYSSFLYPV